jgi:hypothetical protein
MAVDVGILVSFGIVQYVLNELISDTKKTKSLSGK